MDLWVHVATENLQEQMKGEHFTTREVIGQGAYGTVYRGAVTSVVTSSSFSGLTALYGISNTVWLHMERG